MDGAVWAPSDARLTLAFDRQVGRKGVSRMSEDDVLFGYRLRVFDYAARTSVSEACRLFGIHRSTFSVWKRRVERHGLEILRPRDRRRHGLNTGAKRLSLVAGYAAPDAPPRQPEPERHVEATRPGELVGMDCFCVGRLSGTKGSLWQLTVIDVCSSYAWAELVSCPQGNPTGARPQSSLAAS